MNKVNEGVPPSNNELKDYLDQRGAYGGIIRETHTGNFYKMKYEELKESNYAYIQLIKSLEEEVKELKEACKLYDLTKCGDCGQYAECMYAEKSLGICNGCWEDNHT
jgi:hypothetical protein